jgi:hypothetical protein
MSYIRDYNLLSGCFLFDNKKLKQFQLLYGILERLDLEQSKRALFQKYKDVLIGYKENHRMSPQEQAEHKLSMMRTPEGTPIPEEVKQDVLSIIAKDGVDAGLKHLTNLYGKEFIQKFNRLMKDDFENIKSISYEDMQALHERIKSDGKIDTIIIATSKYDNTVFSDGTTSYYDPYLTAKGLTYCKMTGKHMRFHALFDYAHLMKLVKEGKGPEDKEEILREMKNYVRASLEYIEKYNESVRGTNQPTINVVEIFNELVEYNKKDGQPYEMAWEKYFGITIDDILMCFEGIKKPEGVEFMYNELYGTNGVTQQVKDWQRDEILNGKTPEEVARSFCIWFERPNGSSRPRQRYARAAYEYFMS